MQIFSYIISTLFLRKWKKQIVEGFHEDGVAVCPQDDDGSLKGYYFVFFRTTKLSNHLSSYKLGNDSTFLAKVTKTIFGRYLDTYIG